MSRQDLPTRLVLSFARSFVQCRLLLRTPAPLLCKAGLNWICQANSYERHALP